MKTAKLFQNGQSQAVRLPKEFRFEGGEVFIKKSGSAVVLIPLVHSWDSLIGSLDKFTKDYMAERKTPPGQKREAAFQRSPCSTRIPASPSSRENRRTC